MTCIFCNTLAIHGIVLSNGNIIHDSCYKNANSELNELYSKLNFEKNELLNCQKESGIINAIIRFINREHRKYNPLYDIQRINNNIKIINNRINLITSQIEYVHDYMLQYPPDWKQRCNMLKEKIGNYYYGICSKCGTSKNLHVHHNIPLSQGGSNKIENLILLCDKCHLKYHNREKFSNKKFVRLSIQNKIEIINNAIYNNKYIEFYYKKKDDQEYMKRIIKPYYFKNVPHIHSSESTLCIKGLCFIRNADRTFALKRMKNINIINKPNLNTPQYNMSDGIQKLMEALM